MESADRIMRDTSPPFIRNVPNPIAGIVAPFAVTLNIRGSPRMDLRRVYPTAKARGHTIIVFRPRIFGWFPAQCTISGTLDMWVSGGVRLGRDQVSANIARGGI